MTTDATEDRRTVSSAMKALAAVLLLVPLAGLAVHVALYFRWPEGAGQFGRTEWAKAEAIAAVLFVAASWFHWRRTRMKLVLAARVMAYLWIISIILVLHRAYPEYFGG